nr:ATP-binding cassette domain-containing protein [Desulfobacula sp.]
MSIGQWQMVAISRAFFRDAEIVVLDEPSSALDPKTETAIFSTLKKLIKRSICTYYQPQVFHCPDGG